MSHSLHDRRGSTGRAWPACRTAPMLRVLLTAAICIHSPAESACAEDLSWEWIPSRLAVSILLEPDPELSPVLARRAGTAVGDRIVAEFGAAVRCSIVDVPPSAAFRCLRTVAVGTPPEWEDRTQTDVFQKHCFVRLARAYEGFTVEAREWDVQLGVVGPLMSRTVGHRDLLPRAVAEVVAAGYRLQARVVGVRQNQAVLRIRGGSLFPPGAIARLLPSGQGLLPVLRRRNDDGSLQPGTVVPWTLLTVESADGAMVDATVHSGLRNPLAGRNRSRTEQWAVAVGRSDLATELTIAGQSRGEPLPGCRVYSADAGASTRLLGTTDALGRITIPPASGRVQTVVVTTKYLPLARFPLVHGAVPRTTAKVPGSAKLLATEEWLADWQTRFTDIYIQRRVLATLAAARIEQGAPEAARALLDASEKVESPRDYVEALELRRRTTKGDAPLESRLLDQLFDDSLAVARKLDDSALQAELRSRLASSLKKGAGPATP